MSELVQKAKARKPRITRRKRELSDYQKQLYGDPENPRKVRDFGREYAKYLRESREIENSWLRIMGY